MVSVNESVTSRMLVSNVSTVSKPDHGLASDFSSAMVYGFMKQFVNNILSSDSTGDTSMPLGGNITSLVRNDFIADDGCYQCNRIFRCQFLNAHLALA